MTEKRFRISQGYSDQFCHDWIKNKLLNFRQTVDLLNNLNSENEQLKSENKRLKKDLEQFKKGNIEKQLLEDIRHELVSIDKWYAFEKWYAFKPTSYINTEKEFLQLDFDNLIKRIDKELIE